MRHGVAALLIAAALLVSGCGWGQIMSMSGTTRLVLLNKDATNRLIFFCSQPGHGWGNCGLDVMRVYCTQWRPSGMSNGDCILITEQENVDRAIDMGEAMADVENTPDCLGAFIGPGARDVDWHANGFCSPP
jgi:hypothetical protein